MAEEARCGAALPQNPASGNSDGANGAPEKSGPPVLLAESWDNATDLSGWWMSEKLDGVRAYWDGKQFLSRQGNLYHAPDWFVDGLPQLPLDGELWIGRKRFQRTVGVVRRQDKSDLWREVRFLAFDAPQAAGGFEERLRLLHETLSQGHCQFAKAHEHQRCRDLDALRAELARVESLGGEGLMLRQPGSKYVAGRSATLLKVKTFHDAEAVVVGHQPGAGKHTGRLGALLVRLPDGTDFAIGTGFSDRERANPPTVGAMVTFRYQELSDGGVPRFPSYVGVRLDAASRPAAATTAVAKPVAPTPITVNTGSALAWRFELVEGRSSKFWEVSQSGNTMTTRWGRIGSAGQSKSKTFADEQAAVKAMEKLLEEKQEEGYEERMR